MSANTPQEIGRRRKYSQNDLTVEIDYQVQCTALGDGIDAANLAVEALAGPQGFSLDSVSGQHINRNPLWFKVTAAWKVSSDSQWQTPPLERPSVLSSSYNVFSEPYFHDQSDPSKSVVNSAGDPFDPMPQRQNGLMQLQITKNFADFPVVAYAANNWTVNIGEITIRGTTYLEKTLLFMPPSVQERWEIVNKISEHYYQTTFRLAANADGHDQKVVQRGYRQIQTAGQKPVAILGQDGLPVTQPRPLDANGKELANGAAIVLVTFKPYKTASWGIDFD